MNLCIDLEKDDFRLNSKEKEIHRWIGEVEKFYIEIRSLIEKLKNLEIILKNDFENHDKIGIFLVKYFVEIEKHEIFRK